MRRLAESKTRLQLETPVAVKGRALVARVETWGLSMRLKGQRYAVDISWMQIYNRASILAAERLREERKHRAKRAENQNLNLAAAVMATKQPEGNP